MDEHPKTQKGVSSPRSFDSRGAENALFPREIMSRLGLGADALDEAVWEAFLGSYGGILHKTAEYGAPRNLDRQRRHDVAMDAYAFILEKLREGGFRRLRAFDGEDREAFTRWLVVVARRLCTDFRRHRYGRVRSGTDPATKDVRRRLADELWEPQDSSELPAGRQSNPEWDARYREWHGLVGRVLGELEPRQRLLLAYRFEEDLPARRIAELMDFPTPFHVYRELTKILRGLRARLEALGMENPEP